jgi:protoheme ferro-lyase
VILASVVVMSLVTGTLFFAFNTDSDSSIVNKEYIFNTWKVQKFYKNGKLVVNNKRFDELQLRINKNGTADWIRPDGKLTLSFRISPDATQIFTDDGFSIEDIETIFELKKDRLRFGKRNIIAQYEYVMVPAE